MQVFIYIIAHRHFVKLCGIIVGVITFGQYQYVNIISAKSYYRNISVTGSLSHLIYNH